MFPLKQRKLIRGWDAHIAAGLGGAADYEANFITDYVPFDGVLQNYYGPEGGYWCRLTRANGDKIEMAHHSKYLRSNGDAKSGQEMAITGNSGTITTGPHLHIQIIGPDGKRKDPEKYDWESLTTTFMKITVIANNNNWTTLAAQIQALDDYFNQYSGGRLRIVGDIVRTSFTSIPLAPFLGAEGAKSVDPAWYRQNITPLCTGQISVFLMNPSEYNNGAIWGFMTFGDPGKPVRCEITPLENVPSPEGTPIFVVQAFHEICHALFFLTGQTDRVHELIYPLPGQPKAILDLIDYPKLQAELIKIKPEGASMPNQAKVVKSKVDGSIYVAYEMPDMDYLNKKAALEGFVVPNPIPSTDTLN